MIRKFKKNDINEIEDVMKIWLNCNVQAHDFIDKTYWENNYQMVKEILPQVEVYVYENENEILGFVGLTENYIAGIFVKRDMQSKGIGKQLLDYIKKLKNNLTLQVYEKNQRAVKFYTKENFKIQSENIDENTNEKEFLMSWIK